MKKIIYFLNLLTIVFIFSCKKDKIDNVVTPPVAITPQYTLKEGAYINIDEVKKLVPEAYKKQKKIVYSNSKGQLMTIGIKYEENDKRPSQYNGINYTYDQFYITLYSEADQNLLIQFSGGANFADDTVVVKGLTIIIMPYMISGIDIDRNGEPDKGFGLAEYAANKTLNGKNFKEVFTSKNEVEKAYSEVCYNKEFGLVAFRDKNGELFVFERFE